MKKRVVRIGKVPIGGEYPIAIQSMCNTKTDDVNATVAQIKALERAGCEIVRLAVPDKEAALAIKDIKKQVRIPLVADIHFDYTLALYAIENGVDKVRINPGNIGGENNVRAVVKEAKMAGIPIRIGVNAGSVSPKDIAVMGKEQAMIHAVKKETDILEQQDFHDIVIAVKSSDVSETLRVAQEIDVLYDYPVHIGITETGTLYSGVVKSAVGLGILLHNGIGQTMRVSLSADPVEEVKCAKSILSALEIRRFGVNIIACPTCGRTNVDVIQLANRLEKELAGVRKNIDVAVMGCIVNGPGEARFADIGVAGGNGEFVIFSKGEVLEKVSEEKVFHRLLDIIENF